MKILHVSDLHYNKSYFEWVVREQDNYDVICMTGDFLDEQLGDEEEQVEWVVNWIKSIKTPLFVCSGNHDVNIENSENWLNKIEKKDYYCDGTRVEIMGVKIACAPYENYEGFDDFDCDVLLNHLPPSQTKTAITKDGEDWGDRQLYRALKYQLIRPKIVLSGHVHSPQSRIDELYGVQVYNPALEIVNSKPKCHMIDI
jgi:Icc-related predicted phosphoesterase